MRLAKRGLREEPLIDRAKGAFGVGFTSIPRSADVEVSCWKALIGGDRSALGIRS
jgi:hypothetical protein